MVTCDTVQVQSESLAIDEIYSITDVTATSNSPNTITIEATLSRNNSGPSGQRFVDVFMTLNGERMGNQTADIPQGRSTPVTFKVEDAAAGGAEVCVGIESI
jgi:hypothetical protein